MNTGEVRSRLVDRYPTGLIPRRNAAELIGLSYYTFRSLDYQGLGPKKTVMRKRVYYDVDDLINWMLGLIDAGKEKEKEQGTENEQS